MKNITDNDYKKVIEENPCLVLDFSAVWCGPCKKIEPILEELSSKFPDIPFYKCDVGECQNAAAHFHIYSVPTIILFKDGKEFNRISGLRTAEYLEGEINKLR